MVFTDTDYKLFTIGAKFKSKGFRALSEIIDIVEEKLNKKEVVNMGKLYCEYAKNNNLSALSVERNIRTVIQNISNSKKFKYYFDEEHYTVTDFIYEFIRLKDSIKGGNACE